MPKAKNLRRFEGMDAVCLVCVVLFTLLCLLPICLVVIVSFTSETSLIAEGYSFFPKELSLSAYEKVFATNPARMNRYFLGNQLLNSYIVTILITVVGTILSVLMTSMAAYALSNKQVQYRNAFAVYFVITMLINTGIVPWYMINRSLGLRDNIYALIVPSLFSPFNMMLVRNYMNSLPEALKESARIDGASDFAIYAHVVMPLSTAVLATITLFYGLSYWNNWFNAIMLIDNEALYPLQYFLMVIKSQTKALNELKKMGVSTTNIVPPSESLKMATVVVTIGPIVLLYPFLQKYFIKGIVVGGVKG